MSENIAPLKKKAIYLAILSFIGIMVVTILNLSAIRFNNKKNGFSRKILPLSKVRLMSSMDLNFNSFYIAGKTQHSLYLGNYSVPTHALRVNASLKDTQRIFLSIDKSIKNLNSGPTLHIDSPFFFITEGTRPLILRSKYPNLKLEEIPFTTYFIASIPTSGNSMALQIYQGAKQRTVLARAEFDTPKVSLANALDTSMANIFSSDGSLKYDPVSSKFIYLYYYCNKITCLDSNLSLIYRSHTIDTISKQDIKIAKNSSQGKMALGAPPLTVNKRFSISDNNIYVQSGLLADNENKLLFDNNSIIDVYDLTTGSYKNSFYLPNFKDLKLLDFAVLGKDIIVIYDRYIVSYEM